MIRQLIDRYKRFRTERFLAQTYQCSYAFVGMGQHSLTNLYPVLHYLGVPLKYICVTTERKARLIERKYPHVIATTSLDDILGDKTIKGVFVSASPTAHFSIALRILQSGKSLFIEKPPCQSLQELEALIDMQRLSGSPVAMVGLQKRYAPSVQILRKRLFKEHLVNYDLHYLKGNYPEGDALLDLYIHPLDLVAYLFGKPEIIACQQVAPASYILMLRHPHIVGTLELSTAYTWTSAEESLKVCTSRGIYRLSQMEELTFEPKPSAILGVPREKVCTHNRGVEYLYARNQSAVPFRLSKLPALPLGSSKNFTPVLPDNQIYSQGFFDEIQAFVDAVEGDGSRVASSLESIRGTYQSIEALRFFPFAFV